MNAQSNERKFSYYAGLLDTHEFHRFERMAFRISRGNMFMNKEDIVMDNTGENEVAVDSLESDFIDPKTKKPMRKTLVFMLIYGKDGLLARKIRTMVVMFKKSNILGNVKI